MTDHDKLIDRLGKLKRAAEGEEKLGNEAAAQAFADMFQRLLLEHKLEATDLDFERAEAEVKVGTHRINYSQYPDIKVRKKRVDWIETLGQVIANAHFCKILVQANSSRITLVGRPEDCQVVEYLFITLQRAAEQLANKAYADFSTECVKECSICGKQKSAHRKGNGGRPQFFCPGDRWTEFSPNWAKCRGYRESFLDSFIWRLRDRYNEARRAAESNSQALVRLNKIDSVVLEWIEDNIKGKASAFSGTVAWNRHGQQHGRAAADAIELRANAVSANNKKAIAGA